MHTARSPHSSASDCSRKSNGMRTPRRSWGRDSLSAVVHRDIASRRDDVDAVRFEPHVLAGFEHCQCSMRRQQLDHHARMDGVEMLNQDESHADLGGKRREECAIGLKPAGGGTNRGHREVGIARRNCALLRSAWAPCPLRPGADWRVTRRHGAGPISLARTVCCTCAGVKCLLTCGTPVATGDPCLLEPASVRADAVRLDLEGGMCRSSCFAAAAALEAWPVSVHWRAAPETYPDFPDRSPA